MSKTFIKFCGVTSIDDYFFIKPKRLLLTHFPKDEKWQLASPTITKKRFFEYPIYYAHAFFYNLTLLNPHQGILKANTNNEIVLHFKTIPENTRILYAFDSDPHTKLLEFTKVEGLYTATISKKNDPFLTLYVNGVSVLDFKISP